MVARLVDWGLLDGMVSGGEYILLDADRQLLDGARQWLCAWAATRGLRSDSLPDGLQVGDLRVRLVHAELGSYLEAAHDVRADVLIANAVLDLVDVSAVLPGLLQLLVPGGVYWFTINYDGESVFEPCHPGDDLVMRAYHRDMDERVRYGRPAGESRTGRRLFHDLRDAGAPALAAGASALGRVPSPGRELSGRRGLLRALHPQHDPRRIAGSPGLRGSRGPGRSAGRPRPATGRGGARLHRAPARFRGPLARLADNRCRHSQKMYRPNDSHSSTSAPATMMTLTTGGSTSAAAMISAMPCTAATTLPQ